MYWLLGSSPHARCAPALLLLGCLGSVPLQAATVTALPANPANVITSGFESPAVAGLPGGFAYAPAGTNWTFECSTGIAAVGGAFNVPATPQGSQAGLLQTPGAGCALSRMTRSFTITTAGRYRLSLQSAQRLSNQQIARVHIDGIEIGRFQPKDADFEAFVFDALSLNPGTHQLSFSAVVTDTDQTLFLDDIRVDAIATEARTWTSGATWNTGSPPTLNDDVVIPAGASVLMDGALSAKSVDVSGRLYCADSNITLSAEWVSVSGRFVCGAPTARYINTFELTLRGPKDGDQHQCMGTPPNQHCMGDKFLGAMPGGAIELHGEERVSWTQLGQTAKAGESTLHLASNVIWRAEDEIVITATNRNADETELHSIHSISEAGTVIQLRHPLQYRHYGEPQTFANVRDSWTLDERAEVGLLTRNIRIQGDIGSSISKFGGHVMTMHDSVIHASGIELKRMGQLGELGRYPFHWHLVRDATGQYVRNSSIRESYNRCITVHGTHNTVVADNVCYDFIGHGYFLEDGIERNNTFDHNLGVLAKRPAPRPAGSTLPLPLLTDYREAPASNGPAVFWISNPQNTYTNNVAAASQGSGFWYHTEWAVTGPSLNEPGGNIVPRNQPFGVFNNNRVHSSRQGYTSCEHEGGLMGMEAPGVLIQNLTVNHTDQAIWPCAANTSQENAIFRRAIVANSENGMQAPAPVKFEDSAFIGYSLNEAPRAEKFADSRYHAVQVYDQGFLFDRVHFVNYDRPTMSIFRSGGGAHKLPGNRVRGLTFQNAPQRFIDMDRIVGAGSAPSHWGDIIHDLDGSYVGNAANGTPRAAVSDHPLAYDASCSRPPGAGISGYGCPYRYTQFRMESLQSPGEPDPTPPRVTILRSDGVHETAAHIPTRFLTEFMATGPYRYAYRFEQGIRRDSWQMGTFNGPPGETSIHEILDVPWDFVASRASWVPAGCYPASSTWLRATSLNQLETDPSYGYYYRDASASLFIKLRGCDLSASPYAFDDVLVCMGPGGSCGSTSRSIAPPTVTINSPQDRQRLSNGSSSVAVSVNANLADAAGLVSAALFAGDLAGGTIAFAKPLPTSTTINLAITLGPGSYPLKLVVKNKNGQSYTAVQQLFIGDTAPRAQILTPDDSATLNAGQSPTLTYSLHRSDLLPPGASFHLLENRIDRSTPIDHGVVTGSPISLAGWSQGRHDVEIAVVLADGSVTANKDSRRFYLMHNGLLADFEDGLDLRSSLLAYGPPVTEQPIYVAWQSAVLGRLNAGLVNVPGGGDDINYMPLRNGTGTGTQPVSVYSLQLIPAMDWSAYSQIRITHAGPAYRAKLQYFCQIGLHSLGTGTSSGGTTDTFSLAGGPGCPVASLHMEYLSGDLLPCTIVPAGYESCPTQHLYKIELIP